MEKKGRKEERIEGLNFSQLKSFSSFNKEKK
jgi:hypothetical protein